MASDSKAQTEKKEPVNLEDKKTATVNISALFNLQGKVAVVTGATGVLGVAMAKGLAAAGAKVGVLGRNEQNANRVVKEITTAGGEAIPLLADVLVQEQLVAAKKTVLEKWKRIDILVNCAGGNMPGATIPDNKTVFEALSIPDLKAVLDLNFLGTVLPTQVFGVIFGEQKSGVVINISSMASERTITRVIGYSAGKAAVDNYTRWMSTEMAKKFGEGVRCNAIAPGFFIGEQNKKLLTNEDGSLTERGKAIVKSTPMARFGEPEELVGTLIWLCSDASKFVTGVVVPVDGGFSAFSGV